MQRTPKSNYNMLYSSQPNLHTETNDNEMIRNVNLRKRKNPDLGEISDLKDSLMKSVKDALNSEICEMKQQNALILKSNAEILQLLHASAANFQELNSKLVTLETKHATAMERISELETQVNELQKQGCKNTVEIRNVPRREKENLDIIIDSLYSNLKLTAATETMQCYRKGRNNAPIIIEFSNPKEKDLLLKATKTFNNENKTSKLNSTHLGIDGDKHPVYISEALTTMNKKILAAARELVKDGMYKYCWTSRGNILLRKADGEPALVLKSCAQVESLRSA